MKKIIYSMRFKGTAAPEEGSPNVLKAATKASSCNIIWRIQNGQGQFEGATGLVTSNFTVGSKGEVTDNHFGVICMQDKPLFN